MALSARQLKTAINRRKKLIELCTMLPEACVEPFGKQHLAIKVRKKAFAYHMFDHHNDGRIAFCCKSTIAEQQRLIDGDPEMFFVPPYLGVSGWVGYRLDSSSVNWGLITKLSRAAFAAAAPRKLVELID